METSDPASATDRIHQIIDVVLDLPEEHRSAAVAAVCAGRPGLAAAVERALSAQAQATLEAALTARRLDDGARGAPDQPGQTIGPYRLLERLGEGSFGEVHVAEQAAPVRRRVALKVLKPGMGSREVIARFEAERQALALMDHPNIAKVFDAGATALGLPYFVMELVRGQPITRYCDEQRLSLRERLELMIPVCRAVQHAHQRGVIHRDLKPGNVLVTVLDGKPVPKVIDFGIAKAIGPALTDATIYTQFRQLIGTPAYMSPEQMALSAAEVDTRSDVYSLGAMLYELVSGRTPFDAETLLRAGLDELRRVVRESDPPKPSTRLSTLDAAARAAIADRQRSGPERLGRLIAGEVDWVVLKAIEKDRARRYQSPLDLAADLERFLAGEAVSAGPPSGLYRARKFVRRHSVGVALAGVALAGLVATTAGTGVGLAREAEARRDAVKNEVLAREGERLAGEQRARAEKQARIATAAMNFLPDVLRAADPAAEGGRRDVTVSEMLDRAMAAADTGIDTQGRPLEPEVVLQSRLTAARLYFWQGRHADGRAQAAKALALAESAFGPDSLEAAEALGAVVGGYWFSTDQRPDRAEGERLARRRLAILDAAGLGGASAAADALHGLGLMLHAQQKFAECVDLYVRLVRLYDTLPEPPPLGLATACLDVALNMLNLGRATEALDYAKRGMEIHERTIAPVAGDRYLARPHAILARVLIALDRFEEAEDHARRSMEIHDRLRGPDHPYPMFERRTLITALLWRGKFDEAAPLIARFDRMQRDLGTPPGLDELTRDAFIARRTGRHPQALAMWLAIEQQAFGGPNPPFSRGNPVVGFGMGEMLGVFTDLGRPAEGLAKALPVYDAIRATLAGLGQDLAGNAILRRLASELLRAYDAVGDEPSRAAAGRLREQHPGLEPAQGYSPAQGDAPR